MPPTRKASVTSFGALFSLLGLMMNGVPKYFCTESIEHGVGTSRYARLRTPLFSNRQKMIGSRAAVREPLALPRPMVERGMADGLPELQGRNAAVVGTTLGERNEPAHLPSRLNQRPIAPRDRIG